MNLREFFYFLSHVLAHTFTIYTLISHKFYTSNSYMKSKRESLNSRETSLSIYLPSSSLHCQIQWEVVRTITSNLDLIVVGVDWYLEIIGSTQISHGPMVVWSCNWSLIVDSDARIEKGLAELDASRSSEDLSTFSWVNCFGFEVTKRFFCPLLSFSSSITRVILWFDFLWIVYLYVFTHLYYHHA